MTRRGGNLPKTLNCASAQKLFESMGWERQKGGKHVIKMVKPGERPFTLPLQRREDYGPALRLSILKAVGLLSDNEQAEEGRP